MYWTLRVYGKSIVTNEIKGGVEDLDSIEMFGRLPFTINLIADTDARMTSLGNKWLARYSAPYDVFTIILDASQNPELIDTRFDDRVELVTGGVSRGQYSVRAVKGIVSAGHSHRLRLTLVKPQPAA